MLQSVAIMPTEATCAICGKPVVLETAKTNEDGKPVHEECYVAKINEKSQLNAMAILTGQQPSPDMEDFVNVKAFNFRCEACEAEYQLFTPKLFSFEQVAECRKLGRQACAKQHPDHPRRMEFPPPEFPPSSESGLPKTKFRAF